MGSQIKLFDKNYIDMDNPNITMTVTDTVATDNGQDIVDFTRNRSNNSAWATTDSTDAANTTIEVNTGDHESIDTIILIGHNFKSFTIQYEDAGWQDFSTVISETTNSDSTTEFNFTEVSTSKIKLIITGCQTVDEDKVLKQLLILKTMRQLEAFPEIKKPSHSTNRKISKMLSGKSNFVSQVGGFKVDLKLKYWNNDADLTAIEQIYVNRLPVLVWLCGGDEDQFQFKRIGYRKEDIYLMRPANDYIPQWYSNIYTTGIDINIKLVEVVD